MLTNCGQTSRSSAPINLTPLRPVAAREIQAALVGACAAATTGAIEGACGTDPATAQPQVTPGMVAEAFQRVPVPRLRSITQPAGKTLVNFDTIFYVVARPFQRTVTLLGQPVTLAITPARYVWRPGDGTTSTTVVPGRAYPAKDVVHRYADADRTVRHRVEVVWTARWRLAGTPWRPVAGTVTTVGPPTALRVAEAVPVLTGTR